MSEKLKACPFCKFTRAKYKAHRARMTNAQPYKAYAPELFRDDRLPLGYSVYCNNCGVTVLFGTDVEDDAVKLWNLRDE